jgi:ParB/RepB/Spo0J family partition protein
MSSSQAESASTLQFLDLPVDRIRPNPNNPRLIFPQEELDRLADSIDLEGILVPIAVYRQDDHYVLVDGERRYKCAQALGLATIPALVIDEKPEKDVLVQMFNIHLIREPWRDIPTAKALGKLVGELTKENGVEPTNPQLRDVTGLTIERVQRLRYVLTLPQEWQDYINEDIIPLNFFWELKRNVIDVLATRRPALLDELGGSEAVATAFVEKRIDGVITDTVGLRNVRPIINYAAEEADSNKGGSFLDDTIRSLVHNHEMSIDEAYEDTVQIMVEADKLERRTEAMVKSFERLLTKARSDDERGRIRDIGNAFISRLRKVIA